MRSLQKEWNHFSKYPRICILKVRPRNNSVHDSDLTIVVERTQTSRDNGAYELSAEIRLDYVVLDSSLKSNPSRGGFVAKWDCIGGVNLTGGAIFLDLVGYEGLHIGTFMMNEIVQWAMLWPKAPVAIIKLMEAQARTEDEKIRRNKFYENFGIHFAYDDPPHNTTGKSLPMLAGELKTNFSWEENISVHTVLDTLLELKTQNEQLTSDLQGAKTGIRFLRTELEKMERRSIFRPLIDLIRR